MADFLGGGGYGVSAIPATDLFNDPRLLQRARLAALLTQNAVAPQGNMRSPVQPFAQAVTGLVAGLANKDLENQYASRRAAQVDTMQRAIQAGEPWTAPGGGIEMAGGGTLPAGAVAPGTGGPEAMYSALAANPDTAAMGLQGAMSMASQKAILRAQLANALAEKGRYIDPNTGQIAPIPGALPTTQAERQAESSGSAAGTYPYDVSKAYIGQGLNPQGTGINPAFVRLKGAESTAQAAGTYPYQIGVERSKPISVYGQSGVYIPPIAVPGEIGAPMGAPGTARGAPAGVPAPSPQSQPGGPQAPGQGAQGPGTAPGGMETFQIPGGGSVIRTSPGPLGAQSGVEQLSKLDADRVSEARKTWETNSRDLATIQMIQDFMPKVATGWSAGTRLEAGRVLQALGADPQGIQSFLGIDPTAGQLLNKKFLELSAGAVRGMGAREPGSVIQMFNKAYPNLETTPQAINLQTNALLMDRQRQLDYANAMEGYYRDSVNGAQVGKEYRGLTGFEKTFAETNNPAMYLKASEAMSGAPEVGWKDVQPAMQQRIIDLIPSGHRFMAPDGTWRTKP